MSDDLQDVNTAEPSAADPGVAPVTATPVMPTDRPEVNVLAEMNRKYARLENQIGQVMTLLSQQAQQPATPARGQATDEELWSLAQQGDRGAFEMYQERIADRRFQARFAEKNQEALVDQQLSALASRYPVFNDTSHPLTLRVQSAYQLMVGRGYQPGKQTMLDAMKTAIADSPDLVAEIHGRGDAARASATRRAQAGQTGATVRDSAPTRQTTQVTAQQNRLAKAYGVKDAGKAIENFKKRQESGQSQLGMVANAINEEL